jgi:DNA-binding NtrC family response regulator
MFGIKNFCEKIVAIATKSEIDLELVRDQFMMGATSIQKANSQSKLTIESDPYCGDYSRRIIDLLVQIKGNKSKVAMKLGISRTTIWRQKKENNIASEFSKVD